MIDIQHQEDLRQVPLNLVGIKNIVLPLLIPLKSKKFQNTIGNISFFTDLSSNNRGSHMSRFVEILYKNRNNHLTFQKIKQIDSINRQECRRTVEEKFTTEKMVEAYEKVLTEDFPKSNL